HRHFRDYPKSRHNAHDIKPARWPPSGHAANCESLTQLERNTMETPDVLKREIKVLTFDQYGTIVDMQKGLTEAVTPFLAPKAGMESRTVSSLGGGARTSRTQ